MITIDRILDVENHIEDVDAVIFDLDDTLYSEKEYVRSGYCKIAKHFEIPEMENQLWAAFERGGKAIDEVLALYRLADRQEEALQIYRFQQPDIHLYDGVADMLHRIGKCKKIGIITDGRPYGQHAKLDALGVQVDVAIITDELGGIEYRKPNSAAFIRMQKVLDVPFEKMVYIGDNTNKDFIAPERLGMKSIWFRNPDGLYVR